ncbi:histidine kinase [Burkholderia gladioli]|uniref:sensor histidine kinase n=1 Tax=Burkholderia gladioli TaxID=28095 RepID=UPI00050F7711|nr:HAMP domain-containing sensor histidine kinase [Burkholderia gladioli]AYQ92272.1 sensor histidine kinase [Burkholderia gladioli]KGE08971.1 histidine kinase [Burkholderia gladioli]
MRRLSLTQRLALVFSVLLLACCGASAWIQIRASDMHEKEVVQRLSRDLAGHIALSASLLDDNGLRPDAVRKLFGQLMGVNPSVEVYLLDNAGRIRGDDAPPGRVKRDRVDLAPVKRFLAGEPLPILGDDPRSLDARKVFSAAPLQLPGHAPSGYIYVVLLGEAHDELAARVAASSVLRTTLWSIALVALLGLLAGLTAFGLITRPLRRFADAMRRFDANGEPDAQPSLPHSSAAGARDEIAVLETTFEQMAARIGEQWRELKQQDLQRRELVANLSHDLRTPLTSLHGYLETLALKDGTLETAERERYLSVALVQSEKVGRLARALFELARLESGLVQPALEDGSLADLVQDVFAKFELSAKAREVTLDARIEPRLPNIHADLGMIERVLTNLLDNALRHTPKGGHVAVELASREGEVNVTVRDTGPGVPAALREHLFRRPVGSWEAPGDAHRGGLGLLLVQRMLQLHGSEARLLDEPRGGAAFSFSLPAAGR